MTLLLMALVMGGTPTLEVDPIGHVFTSTEGVEVAVAALRSPGPKHALVRITRAGAYNGPASIPEDGREVSISWNEEKSHALDTAQLLEEYNRQVKTKK
jgi:hypothetical protein